jgi:hypothetical protein
MAHWQVPCQKTLPKFGSSPASSAGSMTALPTISTCSLVSIVAYRTRMSDQCSRGTSLLSGKSIILPQRDGLTGVFVAVVSARFRLIVGVTAEAQRGSLGTNNALVGCSRRSRFRAQSCRDIGQISLYWRKRYQKALQALGRST